MKKLYSVSAVVILFLIIFSSTASASTLNVGSTVKYKTIQSAVDAAKNGDTINVASGTYKEQVHISKNVVLMGVKYPKVDGFSWLEGTGTGTINAVSYTHLRAHETDSYLVCRLLLEKKKKTKQLYKK